VPALAAAGNPAPIVAERKRDYRLSGGKVPIAASSLAWAEASTGRCLIFAPAGSWPR
jgi:hypothetical protein